VARPAAAGGDGGVGSGSRPGLTWQRGRRGGGERGPGRPHVGPGPGERPRCRRQRGWGTRVPPRPLGTRLLGFLRGAAGFSAAGALYGVVAGGNCRRFCGIADLFRKTRGGYNSKWAFRRSAYCTDRATDPGNTCLAADWGLTVSLTLPSRQQVSS